MDDLSIKALLEFRLAHMEVIDAMLKYIMARDAKKSLDPKYLTKEEMDALDVQIAALQQKFVDLMPKPDEIREREIKRCGFFDQYPLDPDRFEGDPWTRRKQE